MIEIISETSGLSRIAESWNSLAAPFQSPLLRCEWFIACAKAFCPPGKLAVVTVKTNGEISAIAPLTLMERGGIETIEILGGSFLNEPSGLIYRDEESLEELLEAILQLRRPMLLSRLHPEKRELTFLKGLSQKRIWYTIRDTSGTPWLPINTGWAQFEASISASRRASMRRARRRAEESGSVSFEILSPDPEKLDTLLEEIFRVEAAGWKGRDKTAMLSNEPIKRFFDLYSVEAARLGILRFCFMKIDSEVVAVQIAIEHSNKFWVLKIGYDEGWARCSPGTLLMHETIRYAFERGLQSYEFLGSDQPWLHIWARGVRRCVSYRGYPFSLGSVLGLGIDVSQYLACKVLSLADR